MTYENGEIKEKIEKDFRSFESFKEEFTKKALTLFGSGWTWLVENNGKEVSNLYHITEFWNCL